MPTIAAVIFDLDDTLYPEREYAFSGFAAVAAAFEDRLGDRDETAAKMREFFDTEHRRRLFNQVIAWRGLAEDEQLVHGMIEAYRGHRPTISFHPDAASTLTRLRGRYKLGLITDGPAMAQSAKVDALHLRERLDAMILTDELGPEYAKPRPGAFEMIAAQLGVSPAQCVYVADNAAKDFVAPNALGWTTVQIIRPDGIYREQPPAEGGVPRHVIDTLDKLITMLAG